MRLFPLVFIALIVSLSASAQVFHNNSSSGCDVEVAFALSETEGTGEYVMTDLHLLTPGSSWDFSEDALNNRNLFAGEDYEIMFVVRYPNTGLTIYVDAGANGDIDRMVNGCAGQSKRVYSRDGEFHFDSL